MKSATFGKRISQRQNEPSSLNKLIAQRLLYRKVKSLENWRLLLVTTVAILMLSALVFHVELFVKVVILVVLIMWIVDHVILVSRASRLKEEAAVIQEAFDCDVLDIPWPKQFGYAPPTNDRVNELVHEAKWGEAETQSLEDWYGRSVARLDGISARLYCQKANCRWDARLRRQWNWTLGVCGGLLITSGAVLASVVGITLMTTIAITVGMLRLVTYLASEFKAQLGTQKRAEKLQKYLSECEVEANQPSLCDVRLMQAAIFEHRRRGAVVPDWFYRFFRKDTERLVFR